jgi:hypothetical protein
MLNEYGEYISPFGDAPVELLRYPRHLYSTKQTPRGAVVVLGDRIISEHEMPTAIAQQTADWLNHRKSA